ncbi:terpene synthase family protein [Streptomyces sp. NPDC058289]|uniref:terpene synthase family protein n=1 Tax=Streptomyces sp. NPDC058289 TaxID=3346425 RepID=UPI0036E302A8
MGNLSIPGATLLSGATFRLAPLPCRARARIHSEYPAIYERNAAWVRRHIPESRRQFSDRFPMFDALSYLDAIADRVYQSSCITSLTFACDDLALVEHALFGDLGRDDGHGWVAAFTSAFGTVEAQMPPKLWKQFHSAWRDWYTATCEENALRRARQIPDLDTYLPLRRRSVALDGYLLYLEYALGLTTLTDLRETDPDLDAVRRHAVDHCMLTNDLYSFRKEASGGEHANAVSILIAQDRTGSLQTAMDTLTAMIAHAGQALGEASDALQERYAGCTEVQRYVNGLWDFVAANLFWSLDSPRYSGAGSAWNGLRAAQMVMAQGRTVTIESA